MQRGKPKNMSAFQSTRVIIQRPFGKVNGGRMLVREFLGAIIAMKLRPFLYMPVGCTRTHGQVQSGKQGANVGRKPIS